MDYMFFEFKVKCSNPSCSYVYRVTDIVYPWINDVGYAVYECPQCHIRSRIRVYNVDMHLNKQFCVGVYEDGEENENQSLAVIPLGERNDDIPKKHEYHVPNVPIWIYKDINYEEQAFSIIESRKEKIEEALCQIKNAYLAGQSWAKDIEKLLFKIWVDDKQYVLFQKNVEHDDFSIGNILLIGIKGVLLSDVIDGVYPRDTCFSMLDYLLKRWSLLCKQVIFASPFVGFAQKTTTYDEQIRNFWEWLGVTLDINKTLFITKKETFARFKTAMEELGIDFRNEKKWDMLSKLVKAAEEYDGRKKGAKNSHVQFYQQFHAKFYAGVFDDHVEVLVGSYNIHQGKTLENLVVERYVVDEFEEKYLKPFNKRLLSQDGETSHYQVGFVELKNKLVHGKILGRCDYLKEVHQVLRVK